MANAFIGRREEVGIALEGARGAGATPTYWIPRGALSFQERVDKVISEMGVGSIAQHLTSVKSDEYSEGTLEAEIRSDFFGVLLQALFGTASSGNQEGDAYKHTFTLQDDNLHDSLAIGKIDPIGQLMFKLVMLKNLTININPGEIVNFSADFESKYPDGWSGMSSTYPTVHRFRGRDLSFKVAANSAALGAASAISLKSLTLNFEKDLTRDNVCGTMGPENIFNTVFRITMEATLNYTDRTYRNYLLNNQQKAVRVELVNSDVTIGTVTNPTFRIDFPKVGFETWERDASLDDITSETLNLEAFYDVNTSKLFSDCYLYNEVVSY